MSETPSPPAQQAPQASDPLNTLLKSPIHYVIVGLFLTSIGVPIAGFKSQAAQAEESAKLITQQLDAAVKATQRQLEEIKTNMVEMRAKIEAQERLNLDTRVRELAQNDYKRGVDSERILDKLKSLESIAKENCDKIRSLEAKK